METPALTFESEPGDGVKMEIVGREFPTVTVTAGEVAVTPAESKTEAVRATGPEVEGVHETE
jgi:hypothetical protein